MLLTLHAASVRPMLDSGELTLEDISAFAKETVGLHGINLITDVLAGATRDDLVHIRDRGDKVGCACLLLTEPKPLPIADPKRDKATAAAERIIKVVRAGHVLGCNSVSVSISGKDDELTFERAAERFREVVDEADKLEVNVLITPSPGLTEDPEKLTELIKKIGGFRVGTCPDFQSAAAAEDPSTYLRRITPYASAVIATTTAFDPPVPADMADAAMARSIDGPPPLHAAYDLEPMVEAIQAVGYDGTLAVHYAGEGDPMAGILWSRDAILGAFEAIAERG